jgi:four helix bundle protein
MATYHSFTDIPLWKESVEFAAEVYKLCETGKLRTDYKMKDQLRGAVASISNNIAEGFEYGNTKIFARFLTYSKGSTGEVFNQFTILYKAEMIDESTYAYFSNKAAALGKKIGGLLQYLRNTADKNPQIR